MVQATKNRLRAEALPSPAGEHRSGRVEEKRPLLRPLRLDTIKTSFALSRDLPI
jgi:hypothetical protein